MEDRSIKYIKILGIILVVGGFLLTLGSFGYSPDTKIEYVGNFNQSYAENQSSTLTPGSRLRGMVSEGEKDISPSDVHTVRNISNFTEDSKNKINDIVQTNNTTAVINSTEDIRSGRNIISYSSGEYHIIEASLNSDYSPLQTMFVGISSIFLGFYFLRRISNVGVKLPDGIRESSNSDWKYDFND
jgi:hypothetical protein